MRYRLHPGLIVVLVVALCGLLVLGAVLLRSRRVATPAAMAAHLPAEEGAILAVDFAALRGAGILGALAGASIAQEPEYRSFVLQTGFNYEQDLDYALAWFRQGTSCLLLRGRFDWPRLRAYVASAGGACRNSFCRLEGSTPERRISFFPLYKDVMALAVGPDDWAANVLGKQKPQRRGMVIPNRAVWLLLPASTLQSAQSLPAGTRPFTRALEGSREVMISLSTQDRTEIQLDVTCRSPREASLLASELGKATGLLRDLMSREKKSPNSRDLSVMLAAGAFQSVDQKVIGRWPIQREFLQSILEDTQ